MMFDLMIKGASLADDIGEFDVACKDGKIVEIAKSNNPIDSLDVWLGNNKEYSLPT